MDAFQFRVLPFGSFVALVTIAWLALGLWRRRGLSDAGWATLLGILGGGSVLAMLVYIRRLPYAAPCLDCGLQDRMWYSCALTFVQGFGFAAGGVVVARILRRRRNGHKVAG